MPRIIPELRSEEWVREYYVDHRKTMAEIADGLGCSIGSVWKAIHRHGIPARTSGGTNRLSVARPGSYRRHPELRDSEWLREMYVNQQQSMEEIAADLGCCHTTVLKALRRHGIAARASGRMRPGRQRSTATLSLGENGESRLTTGGGYILIWCPDSPSTMSSGYMYEHRMVAERTLGRPLQPGEIVHHRNRKRDDNRPENLTVLPSHAAHWQHHAKGGDECD